MKKLLLFMTSTLLLFGTCNQKTELTNEKINLLPPYTRIKTAAADAMIKNAQCNDCESPGMVWLNYRLIAQIMKARPDISRWEFVSARYRKDDEATYRDRHGWRDTDSASMVAGSFTTLMKTTSDLYFDDYYDVSTVCPPPRLCAKFTNPD